MLVFLGFGMFLSLFTPSDKSPVREVNTSSATDSPKAKEWVKVIEISGNSNKRTDTFRLEGGKTRLTYQVGGDFAVLAAFYVLEEGHSLETQGGFPEVTVTESGSDSTFLTKKAGNYYLDVTSANSSWKVSVEEER